MHRRRVIHCGTLWRRIYGNPRKSNQVQGTIKSRIQHTMTLEDTHLQVDLPNAPTDKLLNYDIILRVNDEGDAYEGFSLYDYKNQEEITWVSFNK